MKHTLLLSNFLITLTIIVLIMPSFSLNRNDEINPSNKNNDKFVIEVTIKETTNKKNNVIHSSFINDKNYKNESKNKQGLRVNQNSNYNSNNNSNNQNNSNKNNIVKNNIQIYEKEAPRNNKDKVSEKEAPRNNKDKFFEKEAPRNNKDKVIEKEAPRNNNDIILEKGEPRNNNDRILETGAPRSNINNNLKSNLNTDNIILEAGNNINNNVHNKDLSIDVKSMEVPLPPLKPLPVAVPIDPIAPVSQFAPSPRLIPAARIASPAPVTHQPAPITPQPAPITPQPAPITPQPAPITPLHPTAPLAPVAPLPPGPAHPAPIIKDKVSTVQLGNSVIKQESVEYTMPAVPIDPAHKLGLEHYYPYFYKTHVIDYYEKHDVKNLSDVCPDLGCEWCKLTDQKSCLKCRHGYYLYNSQCFTVCPHHSVADIFRRLCVPLDSNNSLTQVSYLKAFTIGSCQNICGKPSSDCSCLASCISEGNCCSDYHLCEDLINKNTLRRYECNRSNPNCDLCAEFPGDSHAPAKCGKCKEGLFNRVGECLQSCVADDTLMPLNKVCIPNQHCLVNNCAECVHGSPLVCRTCAHGNYMYNNQCLQSCPFRLRADRISWACLEPPVFAWYWIFPSKASCRLRCGRLVDNFEMDCSCHQECFRFANCCQDIEDYCPQFSYWK